MAEEGDASPKRLNGKNVSWPSDDKLCQVRLFAAEDPPSLSGSTLQEFYQAKQTRFMHAAVPISLDDLPPGFEGIAAKHAALDAEAIAALVAQIPWCCPGKYELVPSWQVVTGDESTELTEQSEREVRVLEAIYPRTSAIPPSPAEPPDAQDSNGDTHILEIPLVPVEDEEEYMTEDSLATENTGSESNKISPTQPSSLLEQDAHKDGSASPAINMFNQSLGVASLLKDVDLNVAAAAAAAYAAVKATESGRIDHGLLVKILSNPLLLETLSVVSQKMQNQSIEPISSSVNRAKMNGNYGKLNERPGVKTPSMMTKFTSLHEDQRAAPPDGWLLQGEQGPPGFMSWNVLAGSGAAVASEKPFLASVTREHTIGLGIGHVSGPFGINSQQPPAIRPQLMTEPSSRPLAPRQDYLKGLIHHHGMAKADFMNATSLVPDECKPGLTMERFRPTNVGSMQDPSYRWLGSDRTHSFSFPVRNSREDGIEPVRGKSWKTCIYFNTPRGCRNGSNCSFLHESNTEKKLERTRINMPQSEQVKRPRFEASSDVKN